MLFGREPERARIDALLARGRAGHSGVLVIRGEPGIGKTALLEHAAAAAGDATVLRARGVESEIELAFAGLHELVRPVLGTLERLPGPHADALRASLGLAPAGTAERHLVGAATLELLARLAEERPVVVLVDDVQWMDGPSSAALTFAARRLLADAVAVVLAVRAGEPSAVDGAGLDEIALSGLAPDATRSLLDACAQRPIAADTAAWLQTATGGNPLALVQLAPEAPRLRPGPVGDHVSVGSRIARALGRRLDAVGPDALRGLLAVAVADAVELAPALATARALGGSLGGLEAAEAAGLVELGPGRVAFRHPLVRSVVLARTDPGDRRAAHRAYAAALAGDPAAGDRGTWHAAAGAVAPDEAIAAALAATGERAAGRGGHAAAASAFEQAGRLTPDAARRALRLRRSAEAAWLGGDGPRALELLDDAAALPAAAGARAEAEHLRGRVLARRGPVPDAIGVLSGAAEAIAGEDPAHAAEMLAEAAYAALYASVGTEMDELARRAMELAPPGVPRARCVASIALGAALVLRGDPAASAPLEAAAALIAATPELREDVQLAAWLGVVPAFMRGDPAQYEPLARAVALARERGAVGVLPFALFYLGTGLLATGRQWAEAAAAFAEGQRLAEEAGLPVDALASLAGLARLAARRGAPDAGEHAATVLLRARTAGMPFFEAWALHAQGEAALGRGDAQGALAALEAKQRLLDAHAMEDPDLSPAPELAETLLRLGRDADARAVADLALAQADAKGRPWARARAHRAVALARGDDDAALAEFAAALALHTGAHDPFEEARTRLCLGERLRRAGRRGEARAPLRDALARFDGLGAAPWSLRASAELQATGETVRRRDAASLDELTPQELRVALMLAGGATTRAAAAALYLSPKTVEYHLRHVYLKLGVNSREALAAALRPPHSSSAMSSAARAAPVSATPT
jgi:DNA-binding CsgD family transcriptional regulator